MKKFVAAVGMLAVLAGAASAQGGGGGGGRGTPEQQDSVQLSRLFTGITLSADQTAKAKTIITKAREVTMAMDRAAADFNEKRMAETAKRNVDLKALLAGEADRTKFDENAAAGRGRRGGGL